MFLAQTNAAVSVAIAVGGVFVAASLGGVVQLIYRAGQQQRTNVDIDRRLVRLERHAGFDRFDS